MAKSNSTKKSSKGTKREKGAPRSQMLYAFDSERAKKLRDEQYKDKENVIAKTLNALIGGRKDSYTFAQMSELLGGMTRNDFPLKKMKAEKILKPTKERSEGAAAVKANGAAKPEKKAKKARKPRIKKIDNVEVSEAADESTPF